MRSAGCGWRAAAAGTGRIDEALRVERKVASAQGNPGPIDPRRWARLLSAARLGSPDRRPPPLRRQQDPRRELQTRAQGAPAVQRPGTLVVLTWEELDADVALATRVDGREVALGEATDAASVGLASVMLSTPDAQRAQFAARLRSFRAITVSSCSVHDIGWDGKDFQGHGRRRELATKASESVL